MATANTPDANREPRITYINNVLIELDEAFPDTKNLEMPADHLDDAPEPEDQIVRGS